MMNFAKKMYQVSSSFGLDFRAIFYSIIGFPVYFVNLFKILSSRQRSNHFKIKLFPQFADRYLPAGSASGHYFHQDLWAAKKIYSARPYKHLDVGSRVDGFISHLLVFMDVIVLDIRDMCSKVEGLSFVKFDLMNVFSEGNFDKSYQSVSCLHAIEHFGLGRYGDPVNIDGWKIGIINISKLVQQNGSLYLSVPIGSQRIEFDAHRVFDVKTIIDFAFLNGLVVKSFSYVDDAGDFYENCDPLAVPVLHYGCGCFEFNKV